MVDELCEKLKEINNDSIANTETASTTKNYNEASPQELANQYYAAFPPLSRKSASPSSVINLIPKWIASPKKKQLRKHNRSTISYDDKFHCKVDSEHNMKARLTGKSRFNHKKGYSRTVVGKSDSGTDWDLYSFKNRRTQKNKMSDIKRNADTEQCLETNSDSWMNEDDVTNMNMFEELLGDIRDLLNSPEPQEDTVALMNLANMRDTGKKSFIQCGTNITSSIWSTNPPLQDESTENSFNTALASQHDVLLDIKFSSISIDGDDFDANGWPSSDESMVADNKTNRFFENFTKTNKTNDFLSLPWNPYSHKSFAKWSEAESYEDEILAMNNVMEKSLTKLNHHKEKSSFTEVIPRSTLRTRFNAFNNKATSATYFFKPDVAARKVVEAEKDKEDLLTSGRSHFKPINEKIEVRGHQYADGKFYILLL